MIDTVTLIEFEQGKLSEIEIVEMISSMVVEEGFDSLDGKFEDYAKNYVKKEIMDEEGNVNYIKLKEEM